MLCTARTREATHHSAGAVEALTAALCGTIEVGEAVFGADLGAGGGVRAKEIDEVHILDVLFRRGACVGRRRRVITARAEERHDEEECGEKERYLLMRKESLHERELSTI